MSTAKEGSDVDKETLIENTKALFQSLHEGNNMIMLRQKSLHAACQSAYAAASLTQEEIRKETHAHQCEIEALKRANAQCTEIIEQQRAEQTAARKHFAEVEAFLSSKESLLLTLETSLITIGSGFRIHQSNDSCRQDEITRLATRLQQAEVDSVQLEKQLNQKKEQVLRLTSEIDKQSLDIKSCRKLLDTEAKKTAEALGSLGSCQKEVLSLKNQLSKLSAERLQVEDRCQALEENCRNLETEKIIFLKNQDDSMRSLQSNLHDEKLLRCTAEEDANTLRENLAELTSARDMLQAALLDAGRELRAANEAWDSKWNEENWARQVSEQQAKDLRKAGGRLEVRVKELEKENGTLKEAIRTLKDSVGLASTIKKIREVDVVRSSSSPSSPSSGNAVVQPVGFDAVLGKVSRVKAAVDAYIRREGGLDVA